MSANANQMELHKLVALLGDINGQLELHNKAKTGDRQSMIDFVRFCVLKKVYDTKEIKDEEKIKSFESLMNLIVLEAIGK